MQQRHQAFDVIALEGVDVALEQFGVGRVQGLAALFIRQCAERGAGALESAVDRRHTGIEEFGHF